MAGSVCSDAEPSEEEVRRTVLVKNLDVSVIKKPVELFRYLGLSKSDVESHRFRSVPIHPKYKALPLRIAEKKEHFVPNVPCHMYITLASEGLVQTVLLKNTLPYLERRLFISTISKEKKRVLFERLTSIFVGRLPVSWNEDHLYETFAKYGAIVNVRLLRDATTHLSKLCGYVQFVNKNSVALACKDWKRLEISPGHTLRVERCLKATEMDELKAKKAQQAKEKRAAVKQRQLGKKAFTSLSKNAKKKVKKRV